MAWTWAGLIKMALHWELGSVLRRVETRAAGKVGRMAEKLAGQKCSVRWIQPEKATPKAAQWAWQIPKGSSTAVHSAGRMVDWMAR